MGDDRIKPFLTGPTIYLRPIHPSDLTAEYRDWFNDEEVCRLNGHHRFPNYDEDMREYYEHVIKAHENLVLAICTMGTDRHIGNIALQSIDAVNRTAELAIIIGAREYWARGVGREAASLLVAHGFDELNLHRIYCGTFDDNIGMQKLALSLGFREEGRSREAVFKSSAFRDVVHYGLLRSEYQARVD